MFDYICRDFNRDIHGFIERVQEDVVDKDYEGLKSELRDVEV